MAVEKLNGKVYTGQLNIAVTPEFKLRIAKLKKEKGVNTSAEIRKALEKLLAQIEEECA